ncbi:MAG: UPF0280 family protein [Chloroflexota bacterium]
MYQPRTYRHWVKTADLVSFNVQVKETDLSIRASRNLKSKALRLVLKYRSALEKYIEKNPLFRTTIEPFTVGDDAPQIVRAMAEAAGKAGVGPMAAVAGAIAEFVGTELLDFSPQIIVENGGDIFMKSLEDRVVGIYAGDSPLSGKIGLSIDGDETPLGICTSSGAVGHSLSLGKADAVVVVAPSATLADAAATAIGNLVKVPEDMTRALEFAQDIDGLQGVLIIKDDKMAVWGGLKLCRVAAESE